MRTELQRAIRNRHVILNKPAATMEQKQAAWNRVQAAEKAEHAELLASLAGARIVKVECDPGGGSMDGWCEHESYQVHLEDGRIIEFGSWGHDAWGATIAVVSA